MVKTALVLALCLGGVAEAGEILRLKSGAIRSQLSLSATMADAGLYLIQWKGSVTEADKASLQSLGLSLISYVPDDAFLAQGDLVSAQRAESLPFVHAVLPYEASMKMESQLTRNGIFSFQDAVVLSVQVAPTADIAAIESYFQDSRRSLGVVIGVTSIAKAWELAHRKDVVWVERFLPVTSMEIKDLAEGSGNPTPPPATGFESGTKILNIDSIYRAGFNGVGQIVAIADTGLDSGDANTLMPDFQGQLKSGFAMGLGGKSWGDPMSHGTHVAGSVAGNGKSSNGAIRGGAYGAKLVMEGLFSDILNNISIPGIAKLFDKAYSEGARIHTNSWGAPSSNGRYDTMAVQTDTWLFDHQDFLVLFAAGNDGADMNKDGVVDEGTVSSPGTSKNVLTVGASKNYLLEGGLQRKWIDTRPGKEKWSAEPIASSLVSEDAKGMAPFSSRGPTADGRIKPEVVAPGTNIVSARSHHPSAKPEDSWGVYNDSYLYMGGTSMATPVTAGAMAVIRQFMVKKMGENVSAALLKATVANTAFDLFPGQFGARPAGQEQPTRRPNNHEGWGRVNLDTLATDEGLSFVDEKRGLATGEEKTFSVSVADVSRPLRVTMAYTDAPGAAAAAKTLVNDLDLTVVDPSGKILYPNGKAAKDNTNNMEQVDVLAPVAGVYKVAVKAANVPQGKNGAQPFALVVSKGK